ncbi:MAG: Ig-like domain-containing protein [Muribaculaceae bacterium]|nr:Ig-like domain-containing protein [Muribaculaceae bacterium]
MKFLQNFAKSLLLGAALLTTTSALAEMTIKSVTPMPDELGGGTVEEIASITIKFDEWVYDWGSKSDYYFQYNETDPATLLPVELEYTGDLKGVVITPKAGTQTADGWYYLYIPGGVIELESGLYEDEIEFMWQVKGSGPQPSTMWVTPVAGITVTELSYFYVNFDKTWADGDTSKKITVTGPEGVTIPELVETKEAKDVKITFAGDAKLTEGGTYTLTVPAGRFKLGDYEGAPDNEEIVATYNVVDPAKALKVDPAPGEVTQLSEWTLTGFASVNKSTKGIKVEGPEGVTLPTLKNGASGSGKWSIYFDNEEVVTAPGKYTLYIPADKFYVDDDWTYSIPAQTFEYIIPAGKYSGTVTVNPEQGVVERLSYVEFTFNDATTVVVDKQDDIVFTTPEGSGYIKGVKPSTGNDLTIFLNNSGTDITAPGTYSLKFPEGCLKIDDEINAELTYTWIIEEKPWDGEVEASPADGAELQAINDIDLTFADVTAVTVKDDAAPKDFPALYDKDGNKVAQGRALASGNKLTVSFNEVTAEGEYKVVVPSTLYLVDGKKSAKEITLNYTVTAPGIWEGEVTASPANLSVLESISEVTLTFVGATTLAPDPDAEELPAVYNSQFAKVADLTGIVALDNSLTLKFNEITAEGTYIVVVKKGTFLIDDMKQGEDIQLTYSIQQSGIDSISVDNNGEYVVYNILGRRVLRTTDANAVKALVPGLYIINGNKCVVK